MDYINLLPIELRDIIVYSLGTHGINELSNLSLVNKQFNQIVNDNIFWYVYKNIFYEYTTKCVYLESNN